MPNIELTEHLRSTLKDLRKQKKKRGDELSREIGKGASYISQIENGKIKEIDFELLNEIFHKVIDLPETQYNEFIDSLLNNAASHMTKEELQHEKWMHQFNHEIRKYPIPDELIEFIKNKLQELNTTPEEFVKIINQNRGMEDIDIEFNKLNIEIVDHGNGSYGVLSSILFDLPSEFISDILNKKTVSINYINMQGILFNLLVSSGINVDDAHKQTDKILYDNKFYTIRQRNKLIHEKIRQKKERNELFTFYDIQPTDHDKKYVQLKTTINEGFDILRDKNIIYTCERLESLSLNMKNDLGFMIAIMSLPLRKIDQELKPAFWEDYTQLVKKYIENNADSRSSTDK